MVSSRSGYNDTDLGASRQTEEYVSLMLKRQSKEDSKDIEIQPETKIKDIQGSSIINTTELNEFSDGKKDRIQPFQPLTKKKRRRKVAKKKNLLEKPTKNGLPKLKNVRSLDNHRTYPSTFQRRFGMILSCSLSKYSN
jgi:hypothetical protein